MQRGVSPSLSKESASREYPCTIMIINRTIRLFVPCENREVYLYGLDGKPVEGWNPQKTDKPVVSKVQHFRVADKDYIVFADRYRFYILDRKGKERVRVSSVFDLKPHTDVYLTRKGGQTGSGICW